MTNYDLRQYKGYPTGPKGPSAPEYGEIAPSGRFTDSKPIDPFSLLNTFLNSWTIGFDRQFQLLENVKNATKSTYPPYNIIRVDDDETYLIEIAAAGFAREDIEITYRESKLSVKGSKGGDDADYIHKGIAARDFEQIFALADDVKVIDASMHSGVLTITLEREVPEHKKPRIIEIK